MRIIPALSAFALFSAAILAADDPKDKPKAKPKPEVFTDTAKAGPDFLIQGEYSGKRANGDVIGAHVIGNGDGKFTIKLYNGGLPGDGWHGTPKLQVEATIKDGKTSLNVEGVTCEFCEGTLKLGNKDESLVLKRVVRESPTAGEKPPEGAIVLFDGTSTDAWVNGKLVEGNLLKMGTESKRQFGNCTLHVEFRTPFQPKARGQERGNSGVYLQGRYEVQVLDSFGLAGLDNECGAIYSLAAPRINMCYPPLSWQTFDIDYTAAEFDPAGKKIKDAVISVRHNGVLVHDRFKIRSDTTSAIAKEGPVPGPIHLQNHGNPVYYRNIWIVPKDSAGRR